MALEYKGPHGEHMTPSTLRENMIGGILLVLAVIFGVFPYHTVLRYMDATIDRQVVLLRDWTRDVKVDYDAKRATPAANQAQTEQAAVEKLSLVDR